MTALYPPGAVRRRGLRAMVARAVYRVAFGRGRAYRSARWYDLADRVKGAGWAWGAEAASIDPAGWVFLFAPADELRLGEAGFIAGIVAGRFWVLGVVVRRNYPASDQVWPGRCGEFGLLILGRSVSFWNDPGF